MLKILNSEKLGDSGLSELFCVNPVSGHRVRRSGVLFEYTELELLNIKVLDDSDLQAMVRSSYQLRHSVLKSIVNARPFRYMIATNHPQSVFNKIMAMYESLPYYMQPGFEEIVQYGFKLDNGFELMIG